MIDAKTNPEVKRGRPRQLSVRDAVLATLSPPIENRTTLPP